MAIQTAYKVTTEERHACHGGSGSWPMPNGQPGAWKTVRGKLAPCSNGLHLARKHDLIHWLGPAIWLVEYDDSEVVAVRDKIVVRKARLVKRLPWGDRGARLFAADCAEWAIHYVKKQGIVLGDSEAILHQTIKTARAFANGEVDKAAASAAASAAESAAELAAELAALSAAESAAEFAARSAAESAAWSWQTQRLFEYLEGKR